MAATTLWRLEVDGETIEEIRDFEYSSDIMAIGEQCRWSLVNPDEKYVGRLLDGSIAKVYAVNADVNGGAPTLKFKGRVIRRVADYSPQGSLLELQICDLGWHLVNCDAPLWFKLDRAIFQDLIDPAKYLVSKRGSKHYFIDPSFGFTGYSTDGLKRRQVKLSSAQALAAQQTAGPEPVFQVQVEPGQKIYGTISEYARDPSLSPRLCPGAALHLRHVAHCPRRAGHYVGAGNARLHNEIHAHRGCRAAAPMGERHRRHRPKRHEKAGHIVKRCASALP
jgi:hypothetical protein